MAFWTRKHGPYVKEVWDFGPIVKLQLRLDKNLNKSLHELKNIYQQLISMWGSDPGEDGRRIRRRHSSPGNPPFRQTSNLRESIKTDIQIERKGGFLTKIPLLNKLLPTKVVGYIYSDVPYAKILEEGGMTLVDPPKPYALAELKNPLKESISILPRPFWKLGFKMFQARLLSNLKRV